MSSYCFGGFSAYWIEPSGRRANHVGVLGDPRVVGRALEGDVERELHARARGTASASATTSSTVPSVGSTRGVPALGGADRPRAADVAGLGDAGLLLRPLRLVRPIGWIGGRYTTSKPIDAMWSSRPIASRSVCGPSAGATGERGKNSYHALNRPSAGSTSIGRPVSQRPIGSRVLVRQNTSVHASSSIPDGSCRASESRRSAQPPGVVRVRRHLAGAGPLDDLVEELHAPLQLEGDVDARPRASSRCHAATSRCGRSSRAPRTPTDPAGRGRTWP